MNVFVQNIGLRVTKNNIHIKNIQRHTTSH